MSVKHNAAYPTATKETKEDDEFIVRGNLATGYGIGFYLFTGIKSEYHGKKRDRKFHLRMSKVDVRYGTYYCKRY